MAVTLVFNPNSIYIALEAFSVIAAILISILGYRAYKLTKEVKYLYFALAFAFITLSFVARAVTMGSVLFEINEIAHGGSSASFNEVENIFSAGRFAYFILVLGAYSILFALSQKITNKRLLAILGIFMVLFSTSAFAAMPVMFYIVSLVLLAFVAWQYRDNYVSKRKTSTFLTFTAFVLMMLETLMALVSLYYPQLVVGAYICRLLAYGMFLMVFLRVRK